MSRSFLIVLPNETRSGVAPASSAKLDLDHGGRIEARAEFGQELEHLSLRVRLHRVEDTGVGERTGKLGVVVAHHVEIDDHARAVLASVAQEFTDALSHGALPTKGSMGASQPRIEVQTSRFLPSGVSEGRCIPLRAMETREAAMGSSPVDAALDWMGVSRPHAWQ
jgi:hypothetical protein